MSKTCFVYVWLFMQAMGHVFGQTTSERDSLVKFMVHGNCGQCQDRIETAAKVRGVVEAFWDANTQELTLRYLPSRTNPEKIQKLIAGVGHDTQLFKADDGVYAALPECCLYRKGNVHAKEGSSSIPPMSINSGLIKGVVMESDDKGRFHPLYGASVNWLGTPKGVLSDSNGVFLIASEPSTQRLVISYTGYQPDTITARTGEEMRIVLASGHQLKEVKINGRMRSNYIATLEPVRTQVMTERELFKAACCNLSESFETNPSVDVSFNDALTGSKQIQLLGLSGSYTQLTVENLPGPRGLATAMGLNSIAGPWIESIQLTKGIGSVANGFESIAGQINVELKKPEKTDKLFVNGYINEFGKADVNLNFSQKVAKHWSTLLMLHDDMLSRKVDENGDGFLDQPTGNLFSAINRWTYADAKGWMFQVGGKVLMDDKTGGENNFEPSRDKFGTDRYGIGIRTRRYEGFSKLGYVFPGKQYQSIGLQLSSFHHDQDAYFGQNPYSAKQDNVYANLIYQSIIGSTNHKYRVGLSMVSDRYDERFIGRIWQRTETVPGVFGEYTWTPSKTFSMVAGLRGDWHNLFGAFLTPRIHLRYEPWKDGTFRISAGRGQRTANIFAENMGIMTSSRVWNVLGKGFTGAYGLKPEVAWNKGISFDQKFKLGNKNFTMGLDFFRNDFVSQVVVDMEDARKVDFYDLSGKSFSNSFQVELSSTILPHFDVRVAYRFYDVKSTYGEALLDRPYTSKNRGFLNLAYAKGGWTFDYTLNWNGSKRIPVTSSNPLPYRREGVSPSYFLMNAQVSKKFGKAGAFEWYVGGENLTGFKQKDPIIAGDDPFGPWFDASMVWGPINGRMLYTGFRFRIK